MIEAATSGRATCKGCKQKIALGELRFGDQRPGNFDGMMTFWYHLPCAVTHRPEALREALQRHKKPPIPGREELEASLGGATTAARGKRIKGIEKAKTGRSSCQHCKLAIEQDTLRVVVWLHEKPIATSGFVHVGCFGGWAGAAIDDQVIAKANKPEKAGVTAILTAVKLLDGDPRGKELEAGVRAANKPAAEISVLSDWLEGNGAALPAAELAQVLAARAKMTKAQKQKPTAKKRS